MAHHHHAEPELRRSRRRVLFRVVLGLFTLAVLGLGYGAADLWWSWRNVEREAFDQAGFEALPAVPVEALANEDEDLPDAVVEAQRSVRPAEPTGDDEEVDVAGDAADPYDAYLVVGSDEGDRRADVIILALLPKDGSAPLMVSLPRDLYLPNRCTQSLTRLNANYNGCGADLNGPTQLAGAVTDFTGIEIDHFALFTMEGFERIIDAVGGMEICVDHPVREDTRLDLPAGCSLVDGEMALGWVRSRKTQEFVDGRWRTMPEVSDLTRNQRQQDLILDVAGRAGSFGSPAELSGFVASLSDAFTLDDRLGLAGAADLAWSNRHLRPEDVVRLTVPVEPYTTSGGAQVLLPTTPFAEILAPYRSVG